MNKYIDLFLKELQDIKCYDVVKMAITSDYTTQEIADEWHLGINTVQKRIDTGAQHLSVKGRMGLKTAYIEYLEGRLNES